MPIDRSLPPVALNAPFFDPQQDLERTFQFTPDSSRVLFVADLEEPGVQELFSVPAAGGHLPVRLGPPLPFLRRVAMPSTRPARCHPAWLDY